MIRAVVFDFDGVILESVDLKGRAFRRLFGAYPEHLDAIERLHYANGGMSRYEKFRRIHGELLHLPLSDERMQALDEEFGRIVGEEIAACPFVPGAVDCLEMLARRHQLFVASGTPEAELLSIVRQRGLASYFAGVYGSPRTKTSILNALLDEHGYAPDETLFIGDAKQDWQAAAATGVPFVARVPSGEPNPFGEPIVASVDDLAELQERWTEISNCTRRHARVSHVNQA